VTAGPTWLETILRHDRAALAVVLIAIPLLAWTWVVVLAADMYGPMSGASKWMMTMVWDVPHLLLLWAMWAVMMAGMMLPSATPLLLLYGGAARNRDGGESAAPRIYALAAGYLLIWATFSVAATILQRVLGRALLFTPMMEPATPYLAAGILIVAGVYQFLPIKHLCLQACRSPISFLMQRWRPGVAGAFRMGAAHGIYCLGCCWALMLLLFAGGVMNLAVIVALTVWIVFEKTSPFGEQAARLAGVVLLVIAGWMLVGAP
jgi:predicted metal-binding membrane protein